MSLFVLLALAVLGVPVLLVLLAALVLWVRIARARRRATTSRFSEDAETIRARNNALASPTADAGENAAENGDPHD